MPTIGEGLLIPFTLGEEEPSEELAEYQWMFRGYKFGPVKKIEGLDLPVMREPSRAIPLVLRNDDLPEGA
jgi:hypothetical protein